MNRNNRILMVHASFSRIDFLPISYIAEKPFLGVSTLNKDEIQSNIKREKKTNTRVYSPKHALRSYPEFFISSGCNYLRSDYIDLNSLQNITLNQLGGTDQKLDGNINFFFFSGSYNYPGSGFKFDKS